MFFGAFALVASARLSQRTHVHQECLKSILTHTKGVIGGGGNVAFTTAIRALACSGGGTAGCILGILIAILIPSLWTRTFVSDSTPIRIAKGV